jgi:hypothetical protein
MVRSTATLPFFLPPCSLRFGLISFRDPRDRSPSVGEENAAAAAADGGVAMVAF